MRKLLLALLMAGLVGLTACGSNTSGPAPESSALTLGSSEEESSMGASSEAAVPTPEATEPPTSMLEPEQNLVYGPANGLIVAEADVDQDTYTAIAYTVYSIDPDSGEVGTVARFQVPESTDADFYYSISLDGIWDAHRDIKRYFFSDDYSKLCAVKVSRSTGEMHAGWIDTSGSFFDVTEALGLQSQDDSETIGLFVPQGFAAQYFGYTQQFADTLNFLYHYIPVNNPIPGEIHEGKVNMIGRPYGDNGGLLGDEYLAKYYPIHVSSWIDEQRCIANLTTGYDEPSNSVIVDTATGAETEYIPQSTNKNSNGIISPDGTKIAYTSKADVYGAATDIFIIPADGGEPVKVSIQNAPFSLDLQGSCVLIDWR